MRRPLWLCLLVVPLVLAVASSCLAQYEDEKPNRLAFKVGLHRPSGSVLRDRGDSFWKVVGADYHLKLDENGEPLSAVSLEVSVADEDFFKGSLIGASYRRVWRKVRDPEADKGFYYGAGAGVYRLKEERFYNPSEFPPNTGSGSGMKLGFSILGGYDLGPWFGELRYIKLGSMGSGLDFSGLTLYLGAKQLF